MGMRARARHQAGLRLMTTAKILVRTLLSHDMLLMYLGPLFGHPPLSLVPPSPSRLPLSLFPYPSLSLSRHPPLPISLSATHIAWSK